MSDPIDSPPIAFARTTCAVYSSAGRSAKLDYMWPEGLTLASAAGHPCFLAFLVARRSVILFARVAVVPPVGV